MKSNILIAFFIITGVVLRLIWTADMEWKGDEQWMFEHAQAAAKSGNWNLVGMESSTGIVNPGLSVWVFTVISFFTSTPTGMDTGVQLINVFVLLGFVFFVFKKIKPEQREIWLWGLALAAVSPLAVLFSRKIWEQDTIVLFSFFTIVGNAYRTKKLGAFIWGIAGAMAGQVHMSGFFYAFGIVVFSIYYDYLTKTKTQYWWWFVGSVIGSIGLIPWINYLLLHPHPSELSWAHIFQFSFYFYFFMDALGLNIMYSIRQEFWQFIQLPFVGNMPLYLIAVAHLFLAATGLYVVKRIYDYAKKNAKIIASKKAFNNYIIQVNQAEFYLFSILLGLGIFMNCNGAITFQHYLIVGFPFSYLFLSKVLFQKKRWLIATIFAQFFITVSFMIYVHVHNGIENANYGKAYHAQIENKK